MKKISAIYLVALAMAAVVVSCSSDDGAELSPYAYVKTFGIKNFKSSYPTFTETGKDTVVEMTYSGSSFPFTINQVSSEIYNNDSLPYSTNLTKIVMDMTIEGVASLYNEENGEFENLLVDDSVDFTYPRTLRITSSDASYFKDYTVSVNAHKVDPDRMVWSRIETPVEVVPEKAVEFNGDMLLLGRSSDALSLLTMPLDGTASWASADVVGLPETADISTAVVCRNELYILAGGDVYASADAVNWNCLAQGNALDAIIGASDEDGYIWFAGAGGIYRSADGVVLENVGALPEDFPLYGISQSSYPLSHNRNIVRYTLVGYSSPARDGVPQVWSKLSTERNWVKYDNEGNPYPCPSLAGLSVMHYGGFLYAVGGAGTVAGSDVGAFASFYISKDNGIVWKVPSDFNQKLPEELKGANVPFASAVDSNNHMWVITADDNAGAWRGIINKLGFKE